LDAGDYVRIEFSDQGTGISREHLSKVFDPYFSTKQRGAQKAMGLGLAVVEAVVKKHGGHVRIESQLNVGTTISILLPAFKGEESRHDQSYQTDL
jgi:signal transduction histidine kinase